jgi:hypothetical protein
VNCADCTFSVVHEFNDSIVGLRCQRYPPQIFVLDSRVEQCWPVVTNEHWCGEWEGA